MAVATRKPNALVLLDADTGEIIGWRTDGRGRPLTTQLSPEGEAQLSTIASASGGRLIRAEKGTTGIETIAAELRRQMESDYGEKVETVYADVYFYPLGLAILLLVIEVFVGEAPGRRFVRREPPPARGNMSARALLFGLAGAPPSPWVRAPSGDPRPPAGAPPTPSAAPAPPPSPDEVDRGA